MIANRGDRRRRNPFYPSVSITVSVPLTLKNRLEDVVVARRTTISGVIRQALSEWLERNELGTPLADSQETFPGSTAARKDGH